MFNLGIISNAEKSSNKYKEILNQHKYKTIDLPVHNYLEQISKVDAVVIPEDKNIGQTCRLILDIRNGSDALIYVCATECSENNRTLYLELGADGVCMEGAEVNAFPLLVNNALKRMKLDRKKMSHTIEVDTKRSSLEMIPKNLSVLLNGKEEVSMTKLEYIVLDVLHRNAGTALSYQEIGELAWKDESKEIQKYRVANVIFHIRAKIEKGSNGKEFIKTIRSKGYMLNVLALDS